MASITTEAFKASLKNAAALKPLYFITGTEPLLMIEAADCLRARARALGYEDRQVLEMRANADWSQLFDAAASIGMFAPQKLLEVRLESAKPGTRGAKALQEFAKLPPYEGVVVMLSIPLTDYAAAKTAWWKTLSKEASVMVSCDPLDRRSLPMWLAARLRANGQSAAPEALARFADLVEGNLLAAKQEIDKLGLLFGQGELSLEQIESCVANSSRFSADSLVDAIFAKDPERAARIVDGLAAQGEPLPFLLAILTMKLRDVIRIHSPMPGEWISGGPNFKSAAKRMAPKRAAAALAVLADIDKLAKGLTAPARDSDPWIELKSVCLFLAR